MLFQDWRPPQDVGPDGHPRRGGFLPPVHDLPRRMWAGGRLDFHASGLRAGDAVERRSTILAVSEKNGGSGRLVFVTVAHEIEGPRGPVLREEHDIVYRGAEGAAVRPAEPAPAMGETTRRGLLPDALLLFRYSALTGNGHRIHYDMPYVTGGGGLSRPRRPWAPAGDADGPGAARRSRARGARGPLRLPRPPALLRRPPLAVLAKLEGTRALAETRDEDGATCMAAEAVLG
jgi:hypothetical protein